MECSCQIDAGVDDCVEVLSEKYTTSRFNRTCEECGRKIPIGEIHVREIYEYDGEYATHRTCDDCMSIRKNMVESFYYGQIREMVSEEIEYCGGEIPESCISKLTPHAREWVCGEIEKAWVNE